MEKNEVQQYAIGLLLLTVAGVLAGLLPHLALPGGQRNAPVARDTKDEHIEIKNPFDEIVLEAKSAYVLDLSTGETLYSKHAQDQLPLASLVKLMTAVVAYEHLPKGSVVSPSIESILEEGDTGLLAGEAWNARDLIALTLTASSNDGAHALAAAAGALSADPDLPEPRSAQDTFISMMNEKARSLGLAQTYYVNTNGLDENDESIAGGYGSARDVAELFGYAIRYMPEIVEPTRLSSYVATSLDNRMHVVENTNKASSQIPWLIGGKTGYTTLAGGNLVIAFNAGPGRPIVVSVLGSSLDGRFTDVEALSLAALEYIEIER